MDLRERGWHGMNWINLAKDRDQWRALVNTVINLRVPENTENFLSCFSIGTFSRWAQMHEVLSEKLMTYNGVSAK
jgi:hypothetical protein